MRRIQASIVFLGLAAAVAWGQSPRLRDEVISGQDVMRFAEFQTIVLRIAGSNRIAGETADQLLRSFAAANNRRVVPSAEWRYLLVGGLYGLGVPYDRAMSFMSAIGKEARVAVDTGFLEAVRTVDLKDRVVHKISREEGVRPPVPVMQPLPLYTDAARAAGIEGLILLKCVVLEDGTATNFKIMRSLGYGLDESVVLTIQERWRFRPATRDGEPVPVEANVEVNMRLY